MGPRPSQGGTGGFYLFSHVWDLCPEPTHLFSAFYLDLTVLSRISCTTKVRLAYF